MARLLDEIYHLACPASPVFYRRDPVETTKTSVVGPHVDDLVVGLVRFMNTPLEATVEYFRQYLAAQTAR